MPEQSDRFINSFDYDIFIDKANNNRTVLAQECDSTPPGSYDAPLIVLLPVIATLIIVCNATLLTILFHAKMATRRVNWHITSLACADLLLGFYIIAKFFILASKEKSIYIY